MHRAYSAWIGRLPALLAAVNLCVYFCLCRGPDPVIRNYSLRDYYVFLVVPWIAAQVLLGLLATVAWVVAGTTKSPKIAVGYTLAGAVPLFRVSILLLSIKANDSRAVAGSVYFSLAAIAALALSFLRAISERRRHN